MPGLSGREILASIKDKDQNAVVVIVTGFADDLLALKAMSLEPLCLLLCYGLRPSEVCAENGGGNPAGYADCKTIL